MSNTTLTLGWTLTSEMPPLSGVTESDRLIRYPRPVELTYLTFSMSMMKRSTPRSFTEFRWVWNVMTVFASMDPFRMTRAVPGRFLTSWTWMVRSGNVISAFMGDAPVSYDIPPPRGSQAMPRRTWAEVLCFYIVTSALQLCAFTRG